MFPDGVMAMQSGEETKKGEFVASVSAPEVPIVRTWTLFVVIRYKHKTAEWIGFKRRISGEPSESWKGEPVIAARAPELPCAIRKPKICAGFG